MHGEVQFLSQKRLGMAGMILGCKHENKRYYRYLKDSGDHFIGEVAYHFDIDKNIYLADVIVHAPYRKMGCGSIGLNLLCDAAKQNGIKQLYDDIAIDNPSVTMFLKNGFVEEYRTSEIVMLKKRVIDCPQQDSCTK